MGKGLVIVESPAKAKTIKGFLGKDFDVQSCYGHIRDLPKDELGVDVDNGFAPKYIIPKDKKKIITNLRASLKGVETVWLATDEDREGEAISWHLVEALKLDKSKVKRIVFHEITKKAIQKAVENPRELNDDLVLAQQARRVLDRLVGYKLSPLLWKKVQSKLSAGRVQSVAVKLIVERERAHESFVPESSFKMVGDFCVDKRKDIRSFTAELKSKQSSEEDAIKLLEKLKGAVYEVKKLDVKPGKRSPSAPFTTSTLQQEAGRKLGISVKQTMRLAQQLYEEGKITYMRTDSVNLSNQAIEESKAQILKDFGHEYCNPRQYQTKSKGAQEAHEAIRPTSMSLRSLPEQGGVGSKLYELIWKRTIASQMSDAELERTVVTISAANIEEDFIARGEVLKFDGFLKVYIDADMEDEPKQGVLPALNIGEELSVNEIRAVQGFTKSPARYSEAGLVRKMEELGIGRPSTYAPTISIIQDRGYVEKRSQEGTPRELKVFRLKGEQIITDLTTERYGTEKGKLVPTDVGVLVSDFLDQHFKSVLDYSFTAKVEEEFDKVAQGALTWNKMLHTFYGEFIQTVDEVLKTSPKVSGERLLGTDPESGKNVYVKIGRYGPMAQIGESDPDAEKPRFARLSKNQRISTITLEEALDLFKLPLELGDFEGKPIKVGVGRYGPYIHFDEQFYSLGRNQDPFAVTKEMATEIIIDKRPRTLGRYEGEDITTGVGRYGPYVKHKNKFFSLPKSLALSEITMDEAIALIEKKRAKQEPGS